MLALTRESEKTGKGEAIQQHQVSASRVAGRCLEISKGWSEAGDGDVKVPGVQSGELSQGRWWLCREMRLAAGLEGEQQKEA